jgi:hypothetical protein
MLPGLKRGAIRTPLAKKSPSRIASLVELVLRQEYLQLVDHLVLSVLDDLAILVVAPKHSAVRRCSRVRFGFGGGADRFRRFALFGFLPVLGVP